MPESRMSVRCTSVLVLRSAAAAVKIVHGQNG
jgi:hypothetical protein